MKFDIPEIKSIVSADPSKAEDSVPDPAESEAVVSTFNFGDSKVTWDIWEPPASAVKFDENSSVFEVRTSCINTEPESWPFASFCVP